MCQVIRYFVFIYVNIETVEVIDTCGTQGFQHFSNLKCKNKVYTVHCTLYTFLCETICLENPRTKKKISFSL